MADDLDKVALDVVARWVLAHRADPEGPKQTRDDYPALESYQWEAINARVDAVVDSLTPSPDEFEAAYERLTGDTT